MKLFCHLACLFALAASANAQGQGLRAMIAGIKAKSAKLDGLEKIPEFDIPCDAECITQLANLESLLTTMKSSAEHVLN